MSRGCVPHLTPPRKVGQQQESANVNEYTHTHAQHIQHNRNQLEIAFWNCRSLISNAQDPENEKSKLFMKKRRPLYKNKPFV